MTQGQITFSHAQPPLTTTPDADAYLQTVWGLEASEINCVSQFKMQPDVFDSESWGWEPRARQKTEAEAILPWSVIG